MTWLRQILEWQQDLKDPQRVPGDGQDRPVSRTRSTPSRRSGQVLSFPTGATPIDFAYTIHTEVGHHTVGAKANGKMVPLRYQLQNGDIIEILTQPSRNPSRDWLNVVQTSRARSKIRAWLNASERSGSVSLGRELTDKELRRYKLNLKTIGADGSLEKVLSKLGLSELDDFYAAVGYGKMTPHSLISALVPESELKEKPDGVVSRVVKRALGRGERRIKVSGMDDMMIALAQCCHPVRGEEIVGYITRGKGVSVHASHCTNVAHLMYDSARKIAVEWEAGEGADALFEVKLVIDVEDQQGLLAKIVSTVSDEKTNIRDVEARTSETHDATITMVVAVADRKQMERVMARIRRIRGVRAVQRALS